MAEIEPSSGNPQGPPSMSFFSRVLGVFIEPGDTFEDIARNPGWIAPLILLTLASLAAVTTMLVKVGASRIALQAIQRSGRAAQMDPAQLSQIAERSAGIMRIVMPVSALFGAAIFLLIVAGLGLLFLNVFFGQHAKFKAVFSVACYANLPSVLGALMAITVMLFGDPAAFNPQAPAPTNPGFFMNPLTTSHVVFALGSSFDILIFWFLALLAIGLSRVVQKKVKATTIFLVYLGVWALLVAFKVGAALLFS